MEFNSVLFPAPESSFEYRELDYVIWIPKKWPFKAPNALKVTKRNSQSDEQSEDSKENMDSGGKLVIFCSEQ